MKRLANTFILSIRAEALMITMLISCIFIIGCGEPNYEHPHVKIETSYGDIEVEIRDDKAPKTAGAFLKNVDKGIYKEGAFYRVLKDESLSADYNRGMIQGGIYHANPALENSLPFIPHESPRETGLSHVNGTISMARTYINTAKSEFFICIGNQADFDSSKSTNPDGQGYAAFGNVVSGMAVVRKIQDQKNVGDKIVSPVQIKKIIRL